MITNYLGNNVLDLLTGRINSVSASVIYGALSTTEPSPDGTNITEPVGNNYKRVYIGNSGLQEIARKFPAASNRSVTNDDTIFFDKATGSWGTCTYFVLFDAATGGHALAYGALTNPVTPIENYVTIIEPNGLTITIE